MSNTAPRDIVERTFSFALDIVATCRELRKRGIDRSLCSQLLRAGTSIGANVEEAQAGHSRADFLSKMTIAQKEAREASYWIRLLAASGCLPEPKASALAKESLEIARVLSAIVVSTRRNLKTITKT